MTSYKILVRRWAQTGPSRCPREGRTVETIRVTLARTPSELVIYVTHAYRR